MEILTYNIQTASGKLCHDSINALVFLGDEAITQLNEIGYTGKLNGKKTTREKFLNGLNTGTFKVNQTKFDTGDFMEEFHITRVLTDDDIANIPIFTQLNSVQYQSDSDGIITVDGKHRGRAVNIARVDTIDSVIIYFIDDAKTDVGVQEHIKEVLRCATIKSNVSDWLTGRIYMRIGMDRPENHDDIVNFISEDVAETADPEKYSDSDFAIGFRRLLEKMPDDLYMRNEV